MRKNRQTCFVIRASLREVVSLTFASWNRLFYHPELNDGIKRAVKAIVVAIVHLGFRIVNSVHPKTTRTNNRYV